jgi:hypothetical protein
MHVALEGEFSNEATVESGVPQGTVLGPILFLCHINDLPNAVSSKVRLFSDDGLLYREIKQRYRSKHPAERSTKPGKMGYKLGNEI